MNRHNKVVLLVVFSLMLAMLPAQFPQVGASPADITVPDDCPTIQEAVYNASFGDTIYVRAGTYPENLVINQSLVLVGEDRTTTIIKGDGASNVVDLNVSGITIRGFTIRDGGLFGGIYAENFGSHTIENNILTNNAFGIYLFDSSGNTIVSNMLLDNSIIGIKVGYSSNINISSNYISESAYGMKLEGSDANSIVGNTVLDTSYGIYLSFSSWNDVDSNNVSGKVVGIYLVYSDDNDVTNNTVSGCAYGIQLYGSKRNTVLGNRASDNAYGILLAYSDTNTVDGNMPYSNDWGIYLYDSDSNTVVHNTASYNTYGIYLISYSNGSSIYHNNFIDNIMQVYQDPFSSNTWDNGIGEGNYWSDYAGEDLDSDGVGDTLLPHLIVDDYPLMSPWGNVYDVAIVSVQPSATKVDLGQVVNIIVVARNEGTIIETFSVTAKYNDTAIGTQTLIDMAPKTSILLEFSWNTTGVAYGNYTVSATATTVPGETDTTDNTLVDGTVLVTLLSDIRGPEDPPGSGQYPPDGVVDGWDYGFIGLAFGKTSADPDWDDYKIADIRGPEDPEGSGLYPPDGIVDGWDYGYCGLQFGESI